MIHRLPTAMDAANRSALPSSAYILTVCQSLVSLCRHWYFSRFCYCYSSKLHVQVTSPATPAFRSLPHCSFSTMHSHFSWSAQILSRAIWTLMRFHQHSRLCAQYPLWAPRFLIDHPRGMYSTRHLLLRFTSMVNRVVLSSNHFITVSARQYNGLMFCKCTLSAM